MKRLYLSFVMAAVLCAIAAAQQPAPTAKLPAASDEFAKNEVFAGFVFQPTDWGPAWQRFYGLNVNYTRFLGEHWGAVADADWTRNNAALVGDLDRGEPHNANTEALRFGVRYNIFRRDHRVQPFGVVTAGGAHMSALLPYPTHQSDLVQKTWFGFTWAGGGGVDVRLTQHLGIRGQWDHTRVPWGTQGVDQSDWDRIIGGAFWRW
jgi:opacity protein-like surface antigen